MRHREFAYGTSEATLYGRAGKRLLDIVLVLPLLLLMAPVVLVLAIAVVVTSGWPAFHGSRRIGRRGPFTMWKLRTMARDADHVLEVWKAANPDFAARFEQAYKIDDDPRITPLGRFLRQTSLDELPQLWNVLTGDMSLVGPRPIVASELEWYGDRAVEFLSLRPGITGRWQINGRGLITYPDRARLELNYCRTFSFVEDVAILLRTLATPIRRDGT